VRIRPILFVIAVAGVIALPALAASRDYTITSDTKIGRLSMQPAPSLKRAKAAFGKPTRVLAISIACSVEWRSRGLRMNLVDLNRTGKPCQNGAAISAVMTSKKWHTTKGLHVGDSLARLRHLYPKSKFRLRVGWWLVTRKACGEVGGQPYGSLVAIVTAKHVSGLLLTIAPCE
jgi:hypothetical protein